MPILLAEISAIDFSTGAHVCGAGTDVSSADLLQELLYYMIFLIFMRQSVFEK